MLSIAGRLADIVGVLPAPIRASEGTESALDRLPEAFTRKLEIVRNAAGPDRIPGLEVSAFVIARITARRRAATERLIAEQGWTDVGVEDVRTMPTVLIGSRDEIRHQLRERRERFGLSYLVASDHDLDAVAQLIDEV